MSMTNTGHSQCQGPTLVTANVNDQHWLGYNPLEREMNARPMCPARSVADPDRLRLASPVRRLACQRLFPSTTPAPGHPRIRCCSD